MYVCMYGMNKYVCMYEVCMYVCMYSMYVYDMTVIMIPDHSRHRTITCKNVSVTLTCSCRLMPPRITLSDPSLKAPEQVTNWR